MFYKRILTLSFIFFTKSIFIHAENNTLVVDSISRTLIDEEKIFLDENFQLLAAKYEISAADAAIIQAKLYPNPNLSVEQGAYNPSTQKWFDISKNGQTAASLQQLIILAGKRSKQIDIAKLNSQISLFQFYDLIRILRYELRTSFYSLYFIEKSISVYDKEIQSLRTLVAVYSDEYKKGNIAFKEIARLQALEFSLENERLELISSAAEKQNNLALLTADTTLKPVKPIMDTTIDNKIKNFELNYVQLLDSSLTNRYDLKIAREQEHVSELNLALQKSYRTPDLVVGANWDRQGSYITNYNSVSLAMDLPVWNRNKGNIKIATEKIGETKELYSQAELQVKNDLNKAYIQLLESDKLFQSFSNQSSPEYERLLDGITKAFQSHTISLLEFIDFYETYKDSNIEFNKLQNNRITALEDLNLATGLILIQ